MHTDAEVTSQKIIFSKETNLPTETLVYENDGVFENSWICEQNFQSSVQCFGTG